VQEEELPETAPKKDDVAPTSNENTMEQTKQADTWFFVAFIILTVTAAFASLMVKIKKKRKIKYTKNRNRKALFLFAQIEKMLSACHSLPKQVRLEDGEEYVKEHCPYITSETIADLMETVRKARFGRGRITSQELQKVELVHQSLYAEAYKKLSFSKKVYLKFILFV
jgi:hypothetical protein